MSTTTAPRKPGSARALFARTILMCEIFVVLFAALVCFGLSVAPVGAIVAVGAWLIVLAGAAAGTLGRGPVGFALGWVLQALLVATGVAMTLLSPFLVVMVAVAVVFAVLWAVSLRIGARVDVERQERYAAELALQT